MKQTLGTLGLLVCVLASQSTESAHGAGVNASTSTINQNFMRSGLVHFAARTPGASKAIHAFELSCVTFQSVTACSLSETKLSEEACLGKSEVAEPLISSDYAFESRRNADDNTLEIEAVGDDGVSMKFSNIGDFVPAESSILVRLTPPSVNSQYSVGELGGTITGPRFNGTPGAEQYIRIERPLTCRVSVLLGVTAAAK